MEFLRGAVLVVAAIGQGLMAGVFGLYANSIMPGLRSLRSCSICGCS